MSKIAKRRHDQSLTQNLILLAARKEFASKGYDGARVDQIAKVAKVNKQLIYYYFSNKDTLFTFVLEAAYRDIREKEAALELDHLPAIQGILTLMDFTWHYYQENPEFIQLLNSENQLKARHLKTSETIVPLNHSWIDITQRLIERGQREGNIRKNVDPMQLNITISALGFFYLINQATLSILYQTDLLAPEALEKRLVAMKETISCWLKPGL